MNEFTGKERDGETESSAMQGLDYFGARYYGSAMGRFTSPDPENTGSNPYDPQSWNGYAYARNNPLLYTDPTGMNYTVCDADGKNCRDLSDQQYADYRASSPNVYQTSGGTLYARNQDGSSTRIGSASYYDENKRASDVQGAQFLYNQTGPVVKGLAAVTLGFVAGAGIVAAAPAAAATPAFIPQVLNFAGKQAAKAAIQGMGLPAAQAAAAISAIARATSSSSIQILKQGQEVVIRIARAGANGYQVIESVIDQAGGKQVVQKAYDAANTLVHYDPKK